MGEVEVGQGRERRVGGCLRSRGVRGSGRRRTPIFRTYVGGRTDGRRARLPGAARGSGRGRCARPRGDARVRAGPDRRRRPAVPRAVGGPCVGDARHAMARPRSTGSAGRSSRCHRPNTWRRATTSAGCGRSSGWRPSRDSSTVTSHRRPPAGRRRRSPRRGALRAATGCACATRRPPATPGAAVPPAARRHGRAGRVRLAQPDRVGVHGHLRRARARLHGGVRRRRPVRPGADHTLTADLGESDLEAAMRRPDDRDSAAEILERHLHDHGHVDPVASTTSPPRVGERATARARRSAHASSPGRGSIASSAPGCSPTPSAPSPSTTRSPCRWPCSRTRRRCTTSSCARSAPATRRDPRQPAGVVQELRVPQPGGARAVGRAGRVRMEVGPDVELRVHDSTAEQRYLVLPLRPAGTEGWSRGAAGRARDPQLDDRHRPPADPLAARGSASRRGHDGRGEYRRGRGFVCDVHGARSTWCAVGAHRRRADPGADADRE